MCFTYRHLSQAFSFAVEQPQCPAAHRPCPQTVHRSVTVKDCWQISHQPSSFGT
jgi:hypothetical protein